MPKQIVELASVTTLSPNDLFVVRNGFTDKKVTVEMLTSFVNVARVVALGSAGLATLGQTGGDGPTASSFQAGWLRLVDSAGNPLWLAIWR